jgi:hypothetical protein
MSEEIEVIKKKIPRSEKQMEAFYKNKEKLILKWEQSRKEKEQYKQNIKEIAKQRRIDRLVEKDIDNYEFTSSDDDDILNKSMKNEMDDSDSSSSEEEIIVQKKKPKKKLNIYKPKQNTISNTSINFC